MEEKKNFKFEINDDLLVYESNIAYAEGAVVRVIDRSLDEKGTYLVISLHDLGSAKGDINRMYAEYSKWIHENDCMKLSYVRPQPNIFIRMWRSIFG